MVNQLNKAKRLSGINTLAYMGIEPITAPLLICRNDGAIPATDDRVGNQIGALWVTMDTTSSSNDARIFLLTRLEGSGPSGIATWTELETGTSGSGVDFITTDDGNTAVPVGGNINIFGGLTDRGGINALNMTTYNDPAGSDNVFIALQESIFLPNTTDINNGVIGLGGTADADRFMHNFGSGNTFLGDSSGNFTLTGINSVGIGDGALIDLMSGDGNAVVGSAAGSAITSGNENSALGNIALSSCTDGGGNCAFGSNSLLSYVGNGLDNNIAIGVRSLDAVIQCNDNIAIGADALGSNASAVGDGRGSSNIAIGDRSLFALNPLAGPDSQYNIAIGVQAGFAQTTASNNIFIGRISGSSVTTGTESVYIGGAAGQLLTTASSNVAIGYQAMVNTIGTSSSNVAIGWNCMADTGHSSAVAIGFNASNVGTLNTSVVIGFRANETGVGTQTGSVIIGSRAGLNLNASTNVVAIGIGALQNGVNFSGDVAIGRNALQNATSSTPNVAVGLSALASASTTGGGGGGRNNTAIGTETLTACTTSLDNTAVGHRALFSFITGAVDAGANTAVGASALRFVTTGIHNCALGDNAGGSGVSGVTTGSYNVFVGNSGVGQAYTGAESSNILMGSAVAGIVGESNTIRIGSSGAGQSQQNRCFVAGIRGITTGVADAVAVLVDSADQLGTISSSARYKDNIQDMADDSSAVMALRPVTFTYKSDEQKRLQYGLIAEEVEQIMPRLVVYDEDGLPQSVRYNDLPQILLNEIQKLEQRISQLEKVCSTQKNCL